MSIYFTESSAVTPHPSVFLEVSKFLINPPVGQNELLSD